MLLIQVISLDGFLNLWDERFHALVAKNLLETPLMPTLYADPILDIPYQGWDMSIIWLHKQPLFLWQIAISFKIFGVNEIALRLPSAIMMSLLVLVTYRIGALIANKKTGFIAAFLFSTSFYMMQLLSGRQELEHNDIAFLFYVTASIWAWLEYIYTKKRIWIVLIGLFSGFAILCKWLVGLVIFLAWGIYNIQHYKFQIKKYLPLLTGLVFTSIVVLPWQILCFVWYPNELSYELEYNTKHLFEVIEGHSGDVWYHFVKLRVIYGILIQVTILVSTFLFFRKSKDKKLTLSFISIPVAIFLFYTIAKTKMPSYTVVTAIPIYIITGFAVVLVFEFLSRRIGNKIIYSAIVSVLLFAMGWSNLKPNSLKKSHAIENNLASNLLHNKRIFMDCKNNLPENSVIFNVKGRHYIECMFYTGFPSYNFIPSMEQLNDIEHNNKTAVVFNSEKIPDYLLNNENIILIDTLLMGWE